MSARRLEIHPAALAEAEDALAWYAERSSQAPQAFIAELDKSIQLILDAPQRWPVYEEGCRRVPLARFPFFVVYREKSAQLIQIIAFAHSRRRPGYWRARTG